MSLPILAFDVLFAHSAQELRSLTLQKTAEGWIADGAPKDKVEKEALTGQSKFVYWQAIIKYADAPTS
jgi:hypothetical protein